MEFGKLIKKIRLSRNLKLKEVSKHINVSEQFLCDIEAGRRKPFSPMTMLTFSKLTNCNIEILEASFASERKSIQIKIPKNKKLRGILFDFLYQTQSDEGKV